MSSKKTQFQKGASGNLKGRPKASNSFAADLLAEAKEIVGVHVHGRRKNMSMVRASFKQLMAKAAGGDLSAMKQLFDRLEKLEEREAKTRQPTDTMTYDDRDREVIGYVFSSLKDEAKKDDKE